MTLPEYLGRTTAPERNMYRLFISWENYKQKYSMDKQRQFREIEHEAQKAVTPTSPRKVRGL